jgi:hypothetical protein
MVRLPSTAAGDPEFILDLAKRPAVAIAVELLDSLLRRMDTRLQEDADPARAEELVAYEAGVTSVPLSVAAAASSSARFFSTIRASQIEIS